MDFYFLLIYLVPLFSTALLLTAGFLIGHTIESRHYRSLAEREAALNHIITTNLKNIHHPDTAIDCAYVDGQAVISSDYFKTFLTSFRKFFGGELKSLERIMERARREALIRMKEDALRHGATQIWNVRLETSTVGQGMGNKNKGLIMAEIHAYGTAVRFQ